jgi:hypothetical protein
MFLRNFTGLHNVISLHSHRCESLRCSKWKKKLGRNRRMMRRGGLKRKEGERTG